MPVYFTHREPSSVCAPVTMIPNRPSLLESISIVLTYLYSAVEAKQIIEVGSVHSATNVGGLNTVPDAGTQAEGNWRYISTERRMALLFNIREKTNASGVQIPMVPVKSMPV